MIKLKVKNNADFPIERLGITFEAHSEKVVELKNARERLAISAVRHFEVEDVVEKVEEKPSKKKKEPKAEVEGVE